MKKSLKMLALLAVAGFATMLTINFKKPAAFELTTTNIVFLTASATTETPPGPNGGPKKEVDCLSGHKSVCLSENTHACSDSICY